MIIEVKKFGEILVSRPAGREAFLAARAYLKPATPDESIFLDFTGVLVMAPSWLDEFLSGLKSALTNPVQCLPSTNASVSESLKAIVTP